MPEILEIGFRHKSVQTALKSIDQHIKKIENLRKEYVVGISAVVYRDIMEHFDMEMGDNGRWPEWSQAYTQHMIKKGKGANFILRDTGRLRNNFKKTSYRKTSQGLLWYNDAKSVAKKGKGKKKKGGSKGGWPYAWMHNTGGENEHGVKMPERRFMWISDAAMEKVATLTAEFTLRGL